MWCLWKVARQSYQEPLLKRVKYVYHIRLALCPPEFGSQVTGNVIVLESTTGFRKNSQFLENESNGMEVVEAF